MQPANHAVDKNSLWPSNGPCSLCGALLHEYPVGVGRFDPHFS